MRPKAAHEKTSHAVDVIARDCIGLRLRLLSRVVTNHFDEALRSLGLKVSQMNILVATAKLGVTPRLRLRHPPVGHLHAQSQC